MSLLIVGEVSSLLHHIHSGEISALDAWTTWHDILSSSPGGLKLSSFLVYLNDVSSTSEAFKGQNVFKLVYTIYKYCSEFLFHHLLNTIESLSEMKIFFETFDSMKYLEYLLDELRKETFPLASLPPDYSQYLFGNLLFTIISSETNIEQVEIVKNIVLTLYERNEVLTDEIQVTNSLIEMYTEYETKNSTILLRFCQIICEVSSKNEFVYNRFSFLIEKIFDICLKKDDILVQMVVIEYIVLFANIAPGRAYLLSSGMIRWMVEVSRDESSPLASQALHGVAYILREVCRNESDWRNSAEIMTVVDKLFMASRELLDSRNVASRMAGIQVLSTFASSSLAALELIVSPPALPRNTVPLIQEWVSAYSSGNVEIQGCVWQSLADVLASFSASFRSGELSQDSENLLKKFYESIGDLTLYRAEELAAGSSTVAIALRAAKQPVVEVRYPAVKFLQIVASYPWGILALFQTKGFLDYITDVITEFSSQGREHKFALVKEILDNPSSGLLSDEIMSKLVSLKKKGPHYVQAKLLVDVMEK